MLILAKTMVPSLFPLFNVDAGASGLNMNVDKCGRICRQGLLTVSIVAMHTNDVLEEVTVPQSPLSLFFYVSLSLSTLPIFGFTGAVASLLTLHSHFSEASPRGKGGKSC